MVPRISRIFLQFLGFFLRFLEFPKSFLGFLSLKNTGFPFERCKQVSMFEKISCLKMS